MSARKFITSGGESAALTVKQVNLMFRAFSDHTRLRILSLLSRGELCVCDIVDVLKLSQPKISRHLGYLRRAGLVLARREGLWMHYRLADAATPVHGKLLQCLTGCLSDVPLLSRDLALLDQRACRKTDGADCCP